MNKQLVPILFSFILLVSCGRTNMLSKEDYSWMPYTGDETLVFRANTGELDTIYLLKKDTMLAYPEAQSISGIKYEVVAVFCNHYGRNKQNPGGSYYLLQVQKAKDNHAEMVFHLSVDSAELYRLSPIKIDSLRKENPITFQTSGKEYDDVYVIYPDDYAKDFYNRDDYVTKLYWSKSYGLIRFDRKDSVYWELEKRW